MVETKYTMAVRPWFLNPLNGCFIFFYFFFFFLNLALLNYYFFFFLTFLPIQGYVFFFLGYFHSADLFSCLPLEMFRCLGHGEDESVNTQQVWENSGREEHLGSREDCRAFGKSSATKGELFSL